MKKILLFSLFSLINISLYAQEKHLKDVKETQELSDKVVSLFYQNKISEAFDALAPYWPMPENELTTIEGKTIKYINIIEQRFGQSIGNLKIKNETISDIAIRETYIIRYANSAIRLIFTYYKNDNGWIVNAFKWDDSFEEEFKAD
ncbi:hypothetical protein HNV08_05280 [Winogradskyella eckloniae]|uniref:hypothetical protein n=1 Tax=Winogradskyella eckloniae TaxID=1089306 RepID=UPI001566BF47|nr:hypothetical protein [Winogradskyella eckloniae]NRD19451.1 hypothetical protein [Winogradskyella eckloniae]